MTESRNEPSRVFKGDLNRKNKLGLCPFTSWLLYDRLEDIFPLVCLSCLGFFTLSIQVLSSLKEYFFLLCVIFIHSESG